MTLDEARDAVGRLVVYVRPRQWGEPGEEGVITSVGERNVFVRYGRQLNSAATRAEDLELVTR